jgi:hypothetical protein
MMHYPPPSRHSSRAQSERTLPGPRRGLGEGQSLIGLLLLSALDQGGGPFDCPGAGLVAEAVVELGGLEADFGEDAFKRVDPSGMYYAMSGSVRRYLLVLVVQASGEISVHAQLVRVHSDISPGCPIRALAGAQGERPIA